MASVEGTVTKKFPSVDEMCDLEIVEGFAMDKFLTQSNLGANMTLKEHIQNIKDMELRDDDIIICAYAKCGTNWLWEMLNMLVTGAAVMHKQHKEVAMLEFIPIEKLNAMSSPRILNTHLPAHLLPVALKTGKCKIMHIMRNPKDVAVSGFHHIDKIGKATGRVFTNSLEHFKHNFLSKLGGTFCNFYVYTREFDEFLSTNPDIPSMVISYEDLHRHTEEHVRRFAKFLTDGVSDTLITDVVKACSFDNMKAVADDHKEHFPMKQTTTGESMIYRKGKVGDWKNHFTVAESEMFDAMAEKELGHTNIRFIYE